MMGRPSGWDVVDQGDDPVKGDPSTLRMMSREYQRISDAADDASTRLQSVKGSGWLTDWEGEAADVFVDAIEDTPSDLSKLVGSYELAATALSDWADTVDDTQYRADGALADAKDATGDLAAAQDRLADAQSTLSHYQSASSDLSKVAEKYPAGSDVPDGVDVPSPAQLRAASDNASVAQGSVSSAQGDIAAAQSRIDAAKRLVADAKGDWQDAEQRTATKIGEAADAGLGKQSTWDKIFGSEAWETIVSVAKVVVAVGGIIAMIIPGPWTLIIAAIALVVLADTLYKMSKGEADGWDLAFSLLDCVPLAGGLGVTARAMRMASKGGRATSLLHVGSRFARGRDVIAKQVNAFNATSKLGKLFTPLQRVVRPFEPGAVRFSQKSVSFNKIDRTTGEPYNYDDITNSMRDGGWRGDPVDVVEMPDGASTSMDNTRIRAARETDTPVQARAHEHHEPLTAREVERFTKRGHAEPRTWGEAAEVRMKSQGTNWSKANPAGSHDLPKLTGVPQ
jgi:uncharacterized protein YukE